jgi:SAM-dependent methyltransferase
VTEHFDQAFWDERYRAQHRLWSGHPNQHLVGEAGQLPAGAALDAGCGEGADAIWLAGRGWRVTGVDLSPVALDRAAAHAAQAGPQTAERIQWVHADLLSWDPGQARYDLVSAQYLHLADPPRAGLLRRLAAAVRPGGTLLIVGHHPSDLQTTMPRPPQPERLFTSDDVACLLTPAIWTVITSHAAPRQATDPDGRTVTIHDAVLRAQRS